MNKLPQFHEKQRTDDCGDSGILISSLNYSQWWYVMVEYQSLNFSIPSKDKKADLWDSGVLISSPIELNLKFSWWWVTNHYFLRFLGGGVPSGGIPTRHSYLLSSCMCKDDMTGWRVVLSQQIMWGCSG